MNAGKITSSFGFKFNAWIANSSAAVPLLTVVPYFLLTKFENFSSNSFTIGPFDDINFSLIHLFKKSFSFPKNF